MSTVQSSDVEAADGLFQLVGELRQCLACSGDFLRRCGLFLRDGGDVFCLPAHIVRGALDLLYGEYGLCAALAHALRQRLDALDALRESLHEFGDAVELFARFVDLRDAFADALLLLLHDGEGKLRIPRARHSGEHFLLANQLPMTELS